MAEEGMRAKSVGGEGLAMLREDCCGWNIVIKVGNVMR